MHEGEPNSLMVPVDKRCSTCKFGHEIVGAVASMRINDDGSREGFIRRPFPCGTVRECYSWWEKELFHPERFIYPNHDDTCVRPKKFKPRTS